MKKACVGENCSQPSCHCCQWYTFTLPVRVLFELYLWGCYLYFNCEVAICTSLVRFYLYFTSDFTTSNLHLRLLPVLYLWVLPVHYLWSCYRYLSFTCEVATGTWVLPVRLLSVLYLWGCYLCFTCEVATCTWALPVRLLPLLYLWGSCTSPVRLLLDFSCKAVTCALPPMLLPVLYLWGCYLCFTCKIQCVDGGTVLQDV